MHPCERALLKHYASAKSSRRGKSSAAARGFIPAGGGVKYQFKKSYQRTAKRMVEPMPSAWST